MALRAIYFYSIILRDPVDIIHTPHHLFTETMQQETTDRIPAPGGARSESGLQPAASSASWGCQTMTCSVLRVDQAFGGFYVV